MSNASASIAAVASLGTFFSPSLKQTNSRRIPEKAMQLSGTASEYVHHSQFIINKALFGDILFFTSARMCFCCHQLFTDFAIIYANFK